MHRISNVPLLRNKARLRRLILFLLMVCGSFWLMVTGPTVVGLSNKKSDFPASPIDSTTSSPKASNENKLSDSEIMQLLRLELAEHDKGALAASDFLGIVDRILVHKKLYDARTTHNLPELRLSIESLEDLAFPWLKAGHKFASVRQLAQSFKGRGIVMTTGQWHFKYARHAITVMRNLGSTLPIQLFYVGDGDLPKEYRDELEAISGVVTIDLESYFDSHGPDLNRWAIKPFSMLASSFEEIIFVDADALFFQPPEVIFNSAAYNDTGAVFYMDRTLYGGMESEGLTFFNKLVKEPSEYAKTKGRLVSKLSTHEGESGVIVWNKRINLHALLLTCVFNSEPHRSIMYKAYHGDKESYWIAHEALKMPYRWASGGGGTVGFIVDPVNHPTKVCGGLYHPDENWKPLWFNGGILRNKHTPDGTETLSLTHWVTDRTFNEPKWDWETSTMPFCLSPNDANTEFGELTPEEKLIGEMLTSSWELLERPNTDNIVAQIDP
ncbi:hypothetical protein BASA83_003399 [Batrachochytrium salamandrivorans]|nr:hypothetical protein BASA83_003399 [Batrachochytrium salamandrivorans]